MIPTLYDKNETQFNNNGIGRLSDCTKCVVTEERNGMYEMELTYPSTGKFYKNIEENSIIICQAGQDGTPQRFRVYKITTPKNGLSNINARHISYQLSGVPTKPFESNSAKDAISKLKSNAAVLHPFRLSTDISSSNYFKFETPDSSKAVLLKLVEVYGGELEFDNENVILHQSRGEDSNITLSYGKDIVDIQKEMDSTSVITGLLPYVSANDTIYYGDIVTVGDQSIPKVVSEDVTSYFEISEGTIPSKAQITNAGRQAIRDKVVKLIENLKVSFIPLWQAEEHKARMQTLKLCDTVRVKYEKLEIDREMKVIKTSYNCLLNRYDSIELGEPVQTLTKIVKDIKKELAEETQNRIVEANKTRAEFKVEADRISAEVSAIDDEQVEMRAEFNVMAGQISSKVSKGDVISSINQSPEQITIDASKIELTGITRLSSGRAGYEGTYCEWNRNELRFYGDYSYIGSINVGSRNLNLYGDDGVDIGGSGQDINVVGDNFEWVRPDEYKGRVATEAWVEAYVDSKVGGK